MVGSVGGGGRRGISQFKRSPCYLVPRQTSDGKREGWNGMI